MNLWLENNVIEVYSIHNERKFVNVEDLLKPKRIKFTNTILLYQKVYIDKLDDILIR